MSDVFEDISKSIVNDQKEKDKKIIERLKKCNTNITDLINTAHKKDKMLGNILEIEKPKYYSNSYNFYNDVHRIKLGKSDEYYQRKYDECAISVCLRTYTDLKHLFDILK